MKKYVAYGALGALAIALVGTALLVSAQTGAQSPLTIRRETQEVLVSLGSLIDTIKATNAREYRDLEQEMRGVKAQIEALAKKPMATAEERRAMAASLLGLTESIQELQVKLIAFERKYVGIRGLLSELNRSLLRIAESVQKIPQ